MSAQKATNKTSAKKQATARKVGIKNVSNSRSSAKKNAGGNAGSGGRGNGGNTGSGVSGKGRNAGNAGNSGRGNGRNAGNTGRNAGRNSNRNTAADNDERMYEADKPAVFDSRIRRELLGIFIAIVAIALFIAVVAPGNAILPGVISDTLRTVFGIGAYIMPFMMFIWAASYFVEQGITGSSLRLVLGLSIIFFSVLSIASALTPGAIENPDLIFEQVSLMKHGGYIGGGVAWFLFSLVGMVISFVILAGLLVFGCVLIGFSITNAVSRLRELVLQRQEDDEDMCPRGPYDMSEIDSFERAAMRARRNLVAATDPLFDDLEPTRRLDPDFTHGNQGRIPLDALDELDALGALNELDDYEALYRKKSDTHDMKDSRGAHETVVLNNSVRKPRSSSGTSAAASAAASNKPLSSQAAEIPYKLPSMSLLRVSRDKSATKAGENELRQTARILQETIDQFGVDAQVEGWVAGPTVTLFKVSLGEGVRLNKINALDEDIALALAAPAVRIFSPIPGTTLVGIEVPNVKRSMILLGDVLPAAQQGPLQLAIGKDVEGESIVANLEKMPHLLIGGTTGSGKSVAINSMIMSLLMRTTPKQVRMILIDPKMVELSLYNDIPHLYVPVVTDAQKAASALAWGVLEMERRLKLFQKNGVKNLEQYNTRVREELKKAALAQNSNDADGDNQDAATVSHVIPFDRRLGLPEDRDKRVTARVALQQKQTPNEEQMQELPLIVIIIDELADLMMVAGKDVETTISRLAQLARAAGLHLIIATQRPSTNVITGLIKANIVNRMAFSVASGIDSRVIIDCPGAEDLIGNGDLLFSRPEYGKPQRIQGCYVSEAEIEAVVEFLKAQAEPEYHEDILAVSVGGTTTSYLGHGGDDDDDPLIWEAAEIIVSSGFGSTSTLQRRLKVGYARAGRIMDMLEMKGVVGPPNGSKPREVLIDDVLDLESLKAIEAHDQNSW